MATPAASEPITHSWRPRTISIPCTLPQAPRYPKIFWFARLTRRSTELHGGADAELLAATHDQIVRRDRDDSTVSSFMQAAPGVTTIDTSDLTLQGSVEAVLDQIASDLGRIRD